jgi:hypothetical protein
MEQMPSGENIVFWIKIYIMKNCVCGNFTTLQLELWNN